MIQQDDETMRTSERVFLAAVLVLGLAAAVAGYFILFGGGGEESSRPEEVHEPPSPPAKRPVPEAVTEIRGDRGAPEEGGEQEAVESSGPAVGYLAGRVVEAKKKPVPEAHLTLYRARHAVAFLVEGRMKPLLENETGPDGTFRMGPLYPGGGYRLVVEGDGFAHEVVDAIQVKEKGDTLLPDIVLTPGITLQGKVKDEKNRPIAGARVTVLNPVVSRAEPGRRFKVQRAALTDEKGAYLIEHVNDTILDVNFFIRADAEGYAGKLVRFQPTFDGKRRYDYDFILSKELTLSGRVLDERGRPLPDARVRAVQLKSNTRPETTALADRKGRFTLKGLARADYYVVASHKAYSPKALPKVRSGRDDVIFTLEPRSGMAGQVVDAGGAPITTFWIDAQLLGPAPYPEITRHRRLRFHHPEGRFIMENLDPGRYELEIASKGFAPFRSKPVKVEREVYTRDLVFTLSRGGSVSGRILSPEGAPLGGVYVYLHFNRYRPNPLEGFFGSTDDVRAPSVKTGRDGTFRMEHVPPDTYQVEFRHRRHPPLRVDDVTVKEGRETPLGDRRLERGAVLHGRVYNDANAPLAGVKVTVIRSDNTVNVTVTSDAQGYYSISNLAPGTYRVYPMAPFRKGENPLAGIGTALRNQVENVEVLEGQDKVLNLVVHR